MCLARAPNIKVKLLELIKARMMMGRNSGVRRGMEDSRATYATAMGVPGAVANGA
jgi:hypothetical protein